jgi:hypothetical protein
LRIPQRFARCTAFYYESLVQPYLCKANELHWPRYSPLQTPQRFLRLCQSPLSKKASLEAYVVRRRYDYLAAPKEECALIKPSSWSRCRGIVHIMIISSILKFAPKRNISVSRTICSILTVIILSARSFSVSVRLKTAELRHSTTIGTMAQHERRYHRLRNIKHQAFHSISSLAF